METRVVDNPVASRFEILVDGKLAGWSEYRRSGSTITFIHTEIDGRFEGHGLASVLVRAALDAARAERSSVRPLCPFVRGYLERHPEYQDLVVRASDPQATSARDGGTG